MTTHLADALRTAGRRRHHPRGSVLFFEGDPARDVLLIVQGDVKLERTTADRPSMLDVLGPDDWLGELGALDGGARSATATALTAVEVSIVDRTTFVELLAEHPTMAMELLAVTGRRLSGASRRQAELGGTDALGRTCARLTELADRFGQRADDGVTVRSPLSQADIAAWAGISRESIVKALGTLRDLGWLSTAGRRFTLLDPDALRARAGAPS